MERASAVFGGFVSASIPFLCAILGALVANLPVSLSFGFLPPPLFALMPIYFWCLFRPDLMPPGATFTVGLVQDFLSGAPIGVWTASFILTYAIADRQRDVFASLSGWGAILGFGTAAFVANVCAYVLGAIYFTRLPSLEPILVGLAMTVLFYAPVAMLLGVVHRRMIGPLRTQL